MDSMRSLNTSLPRSPRKKRSSHPPEQLIQAFKNAALSVTNLYKTAAAEGESIRDAGYQEALDDLLAFLDRENIGLGDGEGWQIRQWATERLDGSPTITTMNESDDDQAEDAKRARSDSPLALKPSEQESVQIKSRSASPARASSAPLNTTTTTSQASTNVQNREIFTFQSNIPYPQDITMQAEENPSTTSQQSSSPRSHPPSTLPASTVRVELFPRSSRVGNKNGGFTTRAGGRTGSSTRTSGPVTGSKRKFTMGDYFDLGNLGDIKEFQGVGKRGRFV